VAYAGNYLKGVIQAAADLLGTTYKIAFGTTGSQLKYPTSETSASKTWQTGLSWATGTFPTMLLTALGQRLDSHHGPWALIDTKGTGVAPVVLGGWQVASVAKNEALNTIAVTLSTNMDSANYYVNAALDGAAPGTPAITSKAVGLFTFRFFAPSGAVIGVNDLTVNVMACGHV